MSISNIGTRSDKTAVTPIKATPQNCRIAALNVHFPYDVSRIVADYACQPVALIFMATQGIPTSTQPSGEPKEHAEVVAQVNTLLKKASEDYDVGLVMISSKKSELVATYVFQPYILGTIEEEDVASRDRRIQHWLREHGHTKMRHLAILQPSTNFSRNIVPVEGLLSEQHVKKTLEILSDQAFLPSAPSLILKHGLLKSDAEVNKLAQLMTNKKVTQETDKELIQHFHFRIRDLISDKNKLLQLSNEEVEILFETLIDLGQIESLEFIWSLVDCFIYLEYSVEEGTRISLPLSLHRKAFSMCEALMSSQHLLKGEIDTILLGMPHIANHKDFPLQLQLRIIEYINDQSKYKVFVRTRQLTQCILLRHMHEECRMSAVDLFQRLLQEVKQGAGFEYDEYEWKKCEAIHELWHVFISSYIEDSCKLKIIEMLHSCACDPNENWKVRCQAATTLARSIWYIAEHGWNQVHDRVVQLLLPLLKESNQKEKSEMQTQVAKEFFGILKYGGTKTDDADKRLLSLFKGLLENAQTPIAVKEALASCIPNADTYEIPQSSAALDLFFYMVSKLGDEKVPQWLQKSYTKSIVQYYLHSETRDLIQRRNPKLALLSGFRTFIQDHANLISSFEEAFIQLKDCAIEHAVKKNKTLQVSGVDLSIM